MLILRRWWWWLCLQLWYLENEISTSSNHYLITIRSSSQKVLPLKPFEMPLMSSSSHTSQEFERFKYLPKRWTNSVNTVNQIWNPFIIFKSSPLQKIIILSHLKIRLVLNVRGIKGEGRFFAIKLQCLSDLNFPLNINKCISRNFAGIFGLTEKTNSPSSSSSKSWCSCCLVK